MSAMLVNDKVVRYKCKGTLIRQGIGKCISFGGLRVDQAIAKAILLVLSPLGINSSLGSIKLIEEKEAETIRQRELVLKQSRYEAERAKGSSLSGRQGGIFQESTGRDKAGRTGTCNCLTRSSIKCIDRSMWE